MAGTDGEMTFNKVFSKETRVVVILQSSEWSHTKWTKIEETAIRNRGFEKGYDFVILIPTEKPVPPLEWLPKNRLWVGLERWGIESAASVIEARIQEFGGQIEELSVVQKVAQADTEFKHKRKVEQILSSTEGVTIATAEFKSLLQEIQKTSKEIQATLGDWHLKIIDNCRQGVNVWSYDHCMTFQWYTQASNTTEGTYAFITFTDGYIDANLNRTDNFYTYTQILADRRQFAINEFDQNGWCDKDSKKNFSTSKQMADKYLNIFFGTVQKHRVKRKNY